MFWQRERLIDITVGAYCIRPYKYGQVILKYNPEKHNRRSIRLKEYDYSQAGAYTKTDLVFGFTGNQILVAVILAQFYTGFYPKTIIR